MAHLPLAPSAKAFLRGVYERYMAAEFGELNSTAEQFTAACRNMGWTREATGLGALPWAREQLDLEEEAEHPRWQKQRT